MTKELMLYCKKVKCDGPTDDGPTDQQTNGPTDRRTDGLMDGQTDGQSRL